MALSKASLNKLRRKLPKGAVPAVVERLKEAGHAFTPQYVYMNLRGHRYNHTVMLELIRYAEEHEQHVRQMEQRIATNA